MCYVVTRHVDTVINFFVSLRTVVAFYSLIGKVLYTQLCYTVCNVIFCTVFIVCHKDIL